MIRNQRDDLLPMKTKFGGLEVSEANRLRRLKEANRRLNKLLDEAMLEIAVHPDLPLILISI